MNRALGMWGISLQVVIAALGVGSWSGVASADSACSGAGPSFCADVNQMPNPVMAPTTVNDSGRPTYYAYKVSLTGVSKPGSGETATFKLTPVSDYRLQDHPYFWGDNSVSGTGFSCNVVDAYPNPDYYLCTLNRDTAANTINFEILMRVPDLSGYCSDDGCTQFIRFTTGEITAGIEVGTSAVLEANTFSMVETVNLTANATYLAPGDSATLVTSPQVADETQQVTSANPVWAKIRVTNWGTTGGTVAVSIINNGPDLSKLCLLGILYVGDGQSHICHDAKSVLGNGVGTRFVRVDSTIPFDGTPVNGGSLTNVIEMTLMDDTTIVPVLQALNLTRYPVFYSAGSAGAYDKVKVKTNLASKQRFSNGDYKVVFNLTNIEGLDQTASAARPFDSLMALMNFVVDPARAAAVRSPIAK